MQLTDLIPLGFAVIGGSIVYGGQSNRLKVVESKLDDMKDIKRDVALILMEIEYIKERVSKKGSLN